MKTLADYQAECDALLAETTDDVLGLLKRISARDLYPALLERVIRALEALAGRGKLFWITQGERTWDEQHALYLKGRRGITGEHTVTNVDAGRSVHNYGGAVDAAGDKDGDLKTGLQPTWDAPWMKEWADECISQGLESGLYWKSLVDGPHVQLPLKSRSLSVDDLKRTYLKGGKLAVFALLDTKNWS